MTSSCPRKELIPWKLFSCNDFIKYIFSILTTLSCSVTSSKYLSVEPWHFVASFRWIKIQEYLYIFCIQNVSNCKTSLGHSKLTLWKTHYDDVIMGAIASQITSLTIVYSIVYSDADQRKHRSSASLAFVRGIQFPAQMASYAENVSIWWRHHGFKVSNRISAKWASCNGISRSFKAKLGPYC